jgi:hypothetical protein
VIHRPSKILSGGQTGADMGGLVAAKRLGITTGGCAPKGYKTEVGEQAAMLKSFGLVEHDSSNYKHRTKENVINSDATLILATDPSSDGTRITILYCEELAKPFLVVYPGNDAIPEIRDFMNAKKPNVLNIAGNRESKSKGITAKTEAIIQAVFSNSAT